MDNHFHLVVETPQPNLVAGMKWFLGTYTSRFNRRHQLFGHLFSGCYKALIVDGSGSGYLRTVCDYVHLNPVRANLLAPEQPLRNYEWSSYSACLQPPKLRAAWLSMGRLLGEMGIPQDSAAGRAQFELRLEERRRKEGGAGWHAMRRGWCLGGEAFRQELLAQMNGQVGEQHCGLERAESAEERAARIVEEERRQRPKGDPIKVAAAARLRRETTMTLKWIRQLLEMGPWTHLNRRLYEQRRSEGQTPS